MIKVVELADSPTRLVKSNNSLWISFWLSILSFCFSMLALSVGDKIAFYALIISILAFVLALAVAIVTIIQYFHRSQLIVSTSGGLNLQGIPELRLNVVSGESRVQIKSIYVQNERKKKLTFRCDTADGLRRTMLLQPHESTTFAVQYLELGSSTKIRVCVQFGRFRTSKTKWRTVDPQLRGLAGIG